MTIFRDSVVLEKLKDKKLEILGTRMNFRSRSLLINRRIKTKIGMRSYQKMAR